MPEQNWLVMQLAAQIAAAHAANNTVSADQLRELIKDVYRALTSAREAGVPEPVAEPAVPIKKSVLGDHIVCLDCGKSFSMLKRHLESNHAMTPEQYRQKWRLPATYPTVAPDYAQVRSTLAKKIGLGRKTAPRKMSAMRGRKRK